MLWLSAVVVSAAEEGYLTVVYKGNFPPEDPFQTVRVARKETKKMVAARHQLSRGSSSNHGRQEAGGAQESLPGGLPEFWFIQCCSTL
ncbi:hypothetical protein E2562_020651 [Oryza meyeriana var. granulata]|uniref:Uncharacterized protein n=1 Tax=Oryza meyeriana var. granulata TaxID=110450 RepID=A0A6G1EBX8_9ORYZ|nr:hypothetical protein E2562_020651 [Oryza meyeriana var. granulata]